MSFARAFLSGVVLSTPEKRFTPNNIGVTQFKIQVTGAAANDAPFVVQVTCWRQLADVVASSVQVGETVMVEGRLQVHKNEQMGQYESFYEVDASNLYKGNMQLLYAGGQQAGGNATSSQNNNANSYAAAPSQQQQPNPAYAAAPVPMPVATVTMAPDEFITEEDIPF